MKDLKNKYLLVASLGVLILAATVYVFPMAGSHPKGKMHISKDWPKNIEPLINCDERISGMWVNANDFFMYQGDTRALNRFLADYRKLENTPLTVFLLQDPRPQMSKVFDKQEKKYDWSLEMIREGWGQKMPPGYSGKYIITVKVWLSEKIDINKIYLFGPIAPIVASDF